MQALSSLQVSFPEAALLFRECFIPSRSSSPPLSQVYIFRLVILVTDLTGLSSIQPPLVSFQLSALAHEPRERCHAVAFAAVEAAAPAVLPQPEPARQYSLLYALP